jgi:hypothetical protein
MLNIVLTLVFSIVMLVFMTFPAMKIVDALEKVFTIPEKWHTILLLFFTVLFSLLIGLFLRFA